MSEFIWLTRTQTRYEKEPGILVRKSAITTICRFNDYPDATVVSGGWLSRRCSFNC